MASPFAATASTQVVALGTSAEMMIDHNNFGNILKISEELSQALSRLVRSVPTLAARAPDVQDRVKGTALKLRALLGCSQPAG